MNGSKTIFGLFRWHSILSITLIISAVALLVVWDWYRVDRDYVRLKDFLKNTRMSVLYDRSPKIARFLDGQVAVEDFKTGEAINHIAVPTLHRVRYQTTQGDGFIVYSFPSGGTGSHNIHLHGGDMLLKSWFGFERSIWVHCTGEATAGLNNDWSYNDLH